MKKLLLLLSALAFNAVSAMAGGGGVSGTSGSSGSGDGTTISAGSPYAVKGSSVAILNGSGLIPPSLITTTPGVSYDSTLSALLLGAGVDLSLSSGVIQASFTYNGGSEKTWVRMGYGNNQLVSSDFDITGLTNDLYGVATGGRIGLSAAVQTIHAVSINATGQEGVFKCYASSGSVVTNGTTKTNQGCLLAFGEQVNGVDKGHTAAIGLVANQDATNSALGTYIAFQTTPNNTTTPLTRAIITHNGQVGILTTTPGNTYGLDVASSVHVSSGLTVENIITSNGGMSLAASQGIGPVSGSTVLPVGFVFTYSSATAASVGTSTATAGNSNLTKFSTWTTVASGGSNPTFSYIGETYEIVCKTLNGGTVTGGQQGLVNSGIYSATANFAYGAIGTANSITILRTRVKLSNTNRIEFECDAQNGSLSGAGDASQTCNTQRGGGTQVVQMSFDNTSAQNFNCTGYKTSGGDVNFVGMDVTRIK